MKLLIENFQAFINEQEGRLPQIYCDMDGVLVDFERGIVDQINGDLQMIRKMKDVKNLIKIQRALDTLGRDEIVIDDIRGKSKTSKPVRDYMYGRVNNDADFWAHLPWMPNGKELWDFIAPYEPFILTTPMDKGSEIGKAFWIDSNLSPAPEKVFMSHEKYNWALDENGEPNILIDDWSKNIVPWAEEGGIAIQHVNANTSVTVGTLRKMGF
jgi:5'(3')-deoxyribonucleotidase